MQAAPADTPEQVIKARTEVTRRIKALGRQGKPKEAINELTSLARMGIQPDVIAATALISACTNNRNMDMAMTVFDELFGAAHAFSAFSTWDPALVRTRRAMYACPAEPIQYVPVLTLTATICQPQAHLVNACAL